MRMQVVLPAPLGPSSPRTVPGVDLEVDALQRLDLAEVPFELFGADDRSAGHGPTAYR